MEVKTEINTCIKITDIDSYRKTESDKPIKKKGKENQTKKHNINKTKTKISFFKAARKNNPNNL